MLAWEKHWTAQIRRLAHMKECFLAMEEFVDLLLARKTFNEADAQVIAQQARKVALSFQARGRRHGAKLLFEKAEHLAPTMPNANENFGSEKRN